MSSKFTFLLLISISLFYFNSLSQEHSNNYFENNTEMYFQFNIFNKAELEQITKIISIDNVKDNIVYAYANEKQFDKFLKLNYDYKILTHPGKRIIPEMSNSIEGINEWDSYPTYDVYIDMMYQFENNYPEICKIIDAGNTVEGRKILFAKISDNINENENEPQFMYSSSMHGDETTGYVLMLRLIDSLLTTYGSNAGVTELINNVEIWIIPLANPDGTYAGGNNTVYGATRYNANFVDLNRNFPDPDDGPHPDGNNWQPETQIMKYLASTNNFILSANFHGGAEVVNYPWDTYSFEHPDDNWFEFISHLYADTAQVNSPSNYMNGFNDGIIRGYVWYPIAGGRQDYFTYFQHGREVTIEISDTKLLNPSQLPAHWNYNKKSFLDYMRNVLYGIKGIVTDTSGNPLNAKIEIINHDEYNSWVVTDPDIGNYYRMIEPGSYDIQFSANDHLTKIINDITVNQLEETILNVELVPENPVPVELISFSANQIDDYVLLNWQTASETNNAGFEIQYRKLDVNNLETNWNKIGFLKGKGNSTEVLNYSFKNKNITNGVHQYRIKQIDLNGDFQYSKTVNVEVNIAVQEYSLKQNYPNPFNPVTTIKYTLPEDSFVKIKLFDVLGKEVKVLENSFKKSGDYKITLDASDLTSGVYYYKMDAGNFIEVKKIMLIK